ncbi:hypothetical protein [Streptacidiphilus neutrinimicus]|uniref:hypothetical protein n=1 Tax=Streptacidiphilus neutrinimicus TaxID=105420 RepID=UPI0005A6F397|nr:hypothetical protein [Streptacidiphilus neutrinimicus]
MGLFGNRRRERGRAELQAAYDEFCQALWAERLRLTEPRMRAARDRARAELGDGDLLTLELWQLHARALGSLGRGEEADREFLAVAGAAGPDPAAQRIRMLALTNRAAQLCFLERFAEADAQAQEVFEAAGTVPAPDDVRTRLSGLNTRAMALTGLGRATEAEALARQGLAEAGACGRAAGSFQRTLGVNLASALNAQGRHAEALDALVEAEEVRDTVANLGGASAIAKARATALLALGRNEEAQDTARAGLTAALSAYGEDHPRVRELRALLESAVPSAAS